MKRIFFLQEVAEDGSDVNMGLDISEKESVHARSMLGASEHARKNIFLVKKNIFFCEKKFFSVKRIFFLQEVAEDGSDVNMGPGTCYFRKGCSDARMLGASEHARSMLRALAVDEVALCTAGAGFFKNVNIDYQDFISSIMVELKYSSSLN